MKKKGRAKVELARRARFLAIVRLDTPRAEVETFSVERDRRVPRLDRSYFFSFCSYGERRSVGSIKAKSRVGSSHATGTSFLIDIDSCEKMA